MWPIILRLVRAVPAVTLPFAAVVGIIGYNLENLFSDKYTPYNDSIKEKREDRLMSDENLANATHVESLKYKANVLNTNLSPSLSE